MHFDRVNAMEQYILKKGSVSLADLVEAFHVSMNTVRRDISLLLKRGNIAKVYGGVCAVPKTEVSKVPPISVRSTENNPGKERIGMLASQLVQDHYSIFLDSGSTTHKIIPYLAERQDITLITYSLSAMYEASKYPSIRLVALGGIYHPDTDSFAGLSTSKNLSGIHSDVVFLSASAISMQGGLSNNNFLEAEIKSAVVSQNSGKQIVAMVDSSKFERSAIFSFCPIETLDALVTDHAPGPDVMAHLKALNVRCIYPG